VLRNLKLKIGVNGNFRLSVFNSVKAPTRRLQNACPVKLAENRLFYRNILHAIVPIIFLAGRMSALAKAEVMTRGRFCCKCT